MKRPSQARIYGLLLAGLILATVLLTTSCLKGDAKEEIPAEIVLPVYHKPVVDSSTSDLIPEPEEIPEEIEEETTPVETPDSADEAGPVIAASIDGAALYEQSYCAFCHDRGSDGERKGPKLENLKDNWTIPELMKFLRSPGDYAMTNSRVAEIGQRYRRVMPSTRLGEEELRALATWVLAEHE